MLGDLKPLVVMVLVAANVSLLPLALLCVWWDWRAFVAPLIVPAVFIIREQIRQSKAQIPPSEYKAPSPETFEEYVKLVQKDDLS